MGSPEIFFVSEPAFGVRICSYSFLDVGVTGAKVWTLAPCSPTSLQFSPMHAKGEGAKIASSSKPPSLSIPTATLGFPSLPSRIQHILVFQSFPFIPDSLMPPSLHFLPVTCSVCVLLSPDSDISTFTGADVLLDRCIGSPSFSFTHNNLWCREGGISLVGSIHPAHKSLFFSLPQPLHVRKKNIAWFRDSFLGQGPADFRTFVIRIVTGAASSGPHFKRTR